MRTARIGTTLTALAAGAALILGGPGMVQAAPAAQQAPQQIAAAQPAAPSVSIPITGTFPDALGGVGTFAGTLRCDVALLNRILAILG